MHAYALEYLEEYLKPGNKVLDVGSGSGYLTACMAAMVKPNGLVVGIDHVKQLVDLSISNISASNREWLDTGLIKMVTGDGRKGCIEYGPYDCIHVGAASPTEPIELINQLKNNGRMFIPIGADSQQIYVYTKDNEGRVSKDAVLGVIYVPLTDLQKQIG
ncbi:Protein-L-isoaspartate(D-aspartate) O-methyltransferase [Smittium culicis]|uniref:protein-L-isoaspartate(D-aspartate) O-methyltransferase n=1 Tax=Smittium culicis TaxID=133412 RepID=A0A1R1YDB7_9FUNG|nr:Protein-L-isoaspartate(D-aspartate) O-methyltransferase [Smittium culicis]